MFGKRGQEGVTLTTLLLIVLGAVVVVVIILGATGGLDFVFGKIDLAPGQDLQSVVTSCEIAAEANLVADYCLTFKEVDINGNEEYLNCEDPRVGQVMQADLRDKISCADVGEGDLSREASQCVSLLTTELGGVSAENFEERCADEAGDVVVNGNACSTHDICNDVSDALEL